MGNLEEWSNQLEEKALRYDVLIDMLKNELKAAMKKEEDEEKQKEEEKHEEKFQRQMEEKLEIEIKKVEIQKKSYEVRGEIVRAERHINAKFPKLIITKFEGTQIDWFHFWNQYENEINRSELHPVSKLTYLKKVWSQK